MTFLEISNRVRYKVWGDLNASPAPAGADNILNDLILEAHRFIQVDYNYWFARTSAIIPTVDGTAAYDLPDEFKEIINCYFQVNGETYYKQPLRAIDDTEAERHLADSTESEYPEAYQIINNQIRLYPVPSEIRNLTINYWTFLAPPAAADFDTHEDDLSIYGDKAIINFAVSELKADIDDFTGANYFQAKFQEAVENLKREDYRRRQSPLSSMDFHGV